MKFTLVRAYEGRLRLRVGKYIFTKEQGQGISALLLGISGVKKVETTPENGGILIEYTGSQPKEEIFNTLQALNLNNLPTSAPTQEMLMARQEGEFCDSLLKLVGGRYVRKWFFPTVLSNCFTIYRSLSYLYVGVKALFCGRATVEVLDATAIGAALLTKDYATASSTMFLLQLSELLLEYSNLRAKNQLAKSLVIQATEIWLVEGEQERQIPMETLAVGDVIRLRKGCMIPVDGSIVQGQGEINEATMTGEPLSLHKSVGATVFAGTVLEEGEVDILVRSLGQDSRIAQIVDFIHSGEETKANIQGKAERLADQIVPVSFGLFFGTFLLTGNLTRAMSVLMVDFSCAIKLTTPIAIISALKEGSERGIVVKGGKYLEKIAQVDCIVFDKTGTLTEALPKVANIIPVAEGYTQDQILTIAACLEEHFPHSIAASIVAEAKEKGLKHPEFHGKVEYIVAHGIVTTVGEQRYFIGSDHFIFEDEHIPYPEDKGQWLQEKIGIDSAVYLAVEDALIGVLTIHDPPRPEAQNTIDQLKSMGISQIMMVTGDNPTTARHISEQLGLDSFVASVLPDGKANIINELKKQGKTVLMVGDGINDAPALSCADVSMTLAGSSDIAREVADISGHSLEDILLARSLGEALMGRISWHYGLIVAFNAGLISLGLLGLLTASQNALFHNISTLAFAGLSTGKLLPQERDNQK